MPQDDSSNPPQLSRRSFLKGLGALAATMLPACRRAEEFAVPYRESPEWTVPGEANLYATCLPRAGGSLPLLAVCHEGAPTLLQPNPGYTGTSGLDARAQSSLWNLYDPNRCRRVRFHGRDEEGELKGAFAAWAQQTAGGGRVGFLFGPNPSPVRDALAAEIARRNPQARFYACDPFAPEGEKKALNALLAPGARTRVSFENARIVLSLGRDFLGNDPVGPCRAFAEARTPGHESEKKGEPSLRLIAVEEAPTLTGGMAQQTLPCPHGMERFLGELIEAFRPLAEGENTALFASATRSITVTEVSTEVTRLARELWRRRGETLVLLGSNYPEHLHAAVLAMNVLLEAVGGPLQFVQGESDACRSLDELAEDLRAGRLETLFLFATSDPAAENAAFADALRAGTAETVRLCLYEDQTAALASWSLPGTHFLEEWGLDRDAEGRLCLRQPAVLPLVGGIAELEILSGLLSSKGELLTAVDAPGGLSPAYHRVKTCFQRLIRPAGGCTADEREHLWMSALETGFLPDTHPRLHRLPRAAFPPLASAPLPAGHCPISFHPDELFQTQADLHNAWLAETWHPQTNLAGTPAARASLPNLRHGELRLLRLRREGLPTLELPVLGDEAEMARGGPHITVPLLSTEAFNTFPWRHVASIPFESIELAPLAETPPQRPIAVFGAEGVPGIPTWPQAKASQEETSPLSGSSAEQWGMSIDLNLCTGCNACLVACRAENNIPTVGRAELLRGRDIQWLRIDRYFVRRGERGYRMSVPVACQQCEAAPCESVCPVNATVHTSDGLSAMVYPRCWGTRYCAANCPYEARRFNFFDYAQASQRAAHTVPNPNVTVRSRGVMEKCSYCVQRINAARRRHKSELMRREILPSSELELQGDELVLPPGTVQTACQAACPMQAITFGNLKPTPGNEASDIWKAHADPRAFRLLPHLGTRPRTAYLARIEHNAPQGE